MLTNLEVIKAFIGYKNAHSGNLKSTGKSLINYGTSIAEHYNGYIIVNNTNYSKSTTTIQNKLKKFIENKGIFIKEAGGVPMGTVELSRFIQ